jgi:hypothetical protein
MKLTDEAGVEETFCIKSYTLSNNLESLSKQRNQEKDVYSIHETLTNKTWLGKPVYRKVFTFENYQVPVNSVGVYKYTPVISPDIEDIVELSHKAYKNGEQLISENSSFYAIYGNSGQYFHKGGYNISEKKAHIYLRNNVPNETPWNISKATLVVEYTKTTDSALSEENNTTSYVHYIPSNSTSNEMLTQSLKNRSVGFFENYTYDSATDSCIKN